MEKILQKIDWDKFRIRSRRDWVIFWVFAALICYAAGSRYAYRADRWLFRFANPYMSDLNQPYTWGQLMVFLFLLAVVAEAMLFLCGKTVKAKVLVLAGALLMPMVILAGYRIHTNLIVSPLWKEEPRSITIFWGEAESEKRVQQRELTTEERQKLSDLLQNMTIITVEDTLEALEEWYLEVASERFGLEDSISLVFAEEYGHSYDLRLRIYDGKVYIWRGYSDSETEITFFEDNGIVEWLDVLKAASENRR